MKKSFKLYIDSLEVLDELSDEEAGKLFKAIRAYEVDGSETLQGLMKAVFTPFKNNIDRAKEAYQKACEKNKANGLKGGRPKTKENPKEPNGLKGNPKNPDKDKDKDKDIHIKNKQKEHPNLNVEALKMWVKYKGKSYTKQGITLSVNKLINFTKDQQMEMVENSIRDVYKGLFDPKNTKPLYAKSVSPNYVDDYFDKQNKEGVIPVIDAEVIQ